MISIKNLKEPKGPWQNLKTMAENWNGYRDIESHKMNEMNLEQNEGNAGLSLPQAIVSIQNYGPCVDFVLVFEEKL